MVASLTTAGVSGGVAQELQIPMGPQMLEDVEEPMLARPATLRDPGSDRDGTTQSDARRVTRTRFTTSRKSKIDAVVLQLQFDSGYMEDGGPPRIACFLLGTDTSSGAIHATMVPDSKKMDMPYVVATTAKWVRDLEYSQHTENQRHELQPVDIRSFDVWEETCTTIRRFDPPASHG